MRSSITKILGGVEDIENPIPFHNGCKSVMTYYIGVNENFNLIVIDNFVVTSIFPLDGVSGIWGSPTQKIFS